MVRVEELFRCARLELERRLTGGPVQRVAPNALGEPSEEEVRAVVRHWFHGFERRSAAADNEALYPQEGEVPPDRREMLINLDTEEHAVKDPYESDWHLEKTAREAMAAHGFRMPSGDLKHYAIGLFRRGTVESVRRSKSRWRFPTGSQPDDDFRDIQASSLPPAFPKQAGLTVTELFDGYIAAPARAGMAPKTRVKYAGFARVLSELLGPATPAARVTREQCREVQKKLAQMPTNAAQRFPGMDAPSVVAQAIGNGLAPMNPKSVGNYLDFLASAFKWGLRERLIQMPEGNPAEGLNASAVKSVSGGAYQNQRRPFTIAELKSIFEAPLYAGCLDDKAGYDEPGTNRPRRGRFWVPLICLFSGMRLNEACQLQTADIETVDGLHLFHLTARGSEQRLKTKAAQRRIPIHPDLLKIGLLQHVEQQRTMGNARLFPELPISKLGYHSDPFSKWFARFLTKRGITDPGVVGHSFRHSFRDRMRAAQVPEDIADALGGWAGGGEGRAYGAGYNAEVLTQHLSRISYPGLDLSHLYAADGERGG
jgi:integrase